MFQVTDMKTGLVLPSTYVNAELKAYDLVPMGMQGRPQRPTADIEGLHKTYALNEIVYSSINLKASSVASARLMVQGKNSKGVWEEIDGHPFRRLMMLPNIDMSEEDYTGAFSSETDISGVFASEIVPGNNGLPVELHPLNPAKLSTVPGPKGVAYYEFKEGNVTEKLKPEQVLIYRKRDPRNKWNGLSPLSVALGSVDADNAQTDYIRSFFNNAGVPSGLLKVKRPLDQEQSDMLRAKWRSRYGREWGKMHDIGILDEDSEYQEIGSRLDQLSSRDIRMFTETRITMVFGVPGLIIYDYAGLEKATYSNLKEAWKGFWTSNLKPMLDNWAAFLTRALLTKFVSLDLILGERIRLWWDLSEVEWLKESEDERHARARENHVKGLWTLNRALVETGEPTEKGGDYRLIPFNMIAVPSGQMPGADAELPPATDATKALATKAAIPPGALKMILKGQKKGRDIVMRRMERDIKAALARHYTAIQKAVEAAA